MENESTQSDEESIRLGSVKELNNCKLFTIMEDNENSFEDDELEQSEVKGVDLDKLGHHI